MRRTLLGLVLTALVTLSALTSLAPAAPAVPTSGAPVANHAPRPAVERGAPGTWTKVSTGAPSIITSASLLRTADRVLHVVYPELGSGGDQLGHTSISSAGTRILHNEVLSSSWSIVEPTPAVVAGPAGGLRVVFGGQQTTSPGYWSNGKMYTVTAPASGAEWTLPAETVGQSSAAYASYGTAATTLADGTPIAAYPLNSAVTWHVGTGTDPDRSFSIGSCCAYDLAMVRSGSEVYVGWYANGGTPETNGTFVRRIEPTVGPILKAPGSSVGTDSVPTERVALAARSGGGVYAAYCTGYPTCGGISIWEVGATRALAVPGSARAARIALAAAPGGRLWLAWGRSSAPVSALRTNTSVTRLGATTSLGYPLGPGNLFALSLEGSTGRGDVVVNNGDGFWHSQATAGLSLAASPTRWRRGTTRSVLFTVADAGARVSGATVGVGTKRCTTNAAGQCRLTFSSTTRSGSFTARATKSGYTLGTRQLLVVR